MSALSADYLRTHKDIGVRQYPVKAAETIYKGSLVMVVSGVGYAEPAANTTGGLVVGFAEKQADNSGGANAAKDVTVIENKLVALTISGVTEADIGRKVFVVDDTTGSLTVSSSGVTCGVVKGVKETNMAWVDMSDVSKVSRAELDEDALSVYGVKVYDVRGADFAPLSVSETAGDFSLSLSADVMLILGEIANNETEVSVGYFQYVLPPEYVSGGDVKIRVKHQSSGAGTADVSTIDFTCKEQDGNGAVGSDLVTTGAQTIVKGTWTTSDFVVTSTGLVAGDILSIKMTTSVAETASSNIQAQIDGLALLLDVKG